MTQEEKAKAYDEALLRADEAVQKGCLDKDMFDIIFPPEESEDERIRKAIISSIEEDSSVYEQEVSKEQMLAYLEKQKEQNKCPEFCSGHCVGCEQKEQKQTDLPAGFYFIDLNGNRYYSKEFRYGDMKLKVGEQKPVEWKPTEEQMEALQRAIDACESEWDYQDDELRSLLNELKKL